MEGTTESWWRRFVGIHHEIVEALCDEVREKPFKGEYLIPFVGYVLYLCESDSLLPLLPTLVVQGAYLYGVIVGIEALVKAVS